MNKQIDYSKIKKWQTIATTAEILGLSKRRVQRLAQQGRFPESVKVGPVWCIFGSSIGHYLNSPRRRPGRPRRPGGSAPRSQPGGTN